MVVVFAAKPGGCEEDDGWLVSFVHNEETNVSQVHIIDAKKMESEPVAKIALPQRVPYGLISMEVLCHFPAILISNVMFTCDEQIHSITRLMLSHF
ncbi:hypothetical protein Q3G72_029193 [Acer saccharum]|nr:hypothetical protein Q3G72_029193 [Acer saccharum]